MQLDTPNKKNSPAASFSCQLVTLYLLATSVVLATDVLDEIQVTATRRAIDTHDVSVGATIIPADTIQQKALITDALQAQVGSYVQETTPGQGAAIIRGMRGSAVLHLVDGMRLNNALFRSAPTQYFALIDPGSVDRMEVARGASASLYGSDAMGGVVQVLSRQPNIAGPDFQTHNDIDLRVESADLSQSIRTTSEFGTEKLASMINLGYRSTGNRRIGGGERIAPTAYDSYSARIATKLQVDDNRSWLLDLQATEQPNTPRIDELVPGFGETDPSSSEAEFTPNQRLFAHARHQYDEGWLATNWTLDLGWQRIVDDRTSRGFGSTARRFESNSSDLLGATLRGSRWIGSYDWVFGADWYHDTVRSSSSSVDIDSGETTIAASRFPNDSSVDQAAIYGNVRRQISTRQSLNAGVRATDIEIDIPGSVDYTASKIIHTDLSGELGWVFEFNPHINLVTNVGRGFRAPNIFDLGTLGPRPGNRFNIPTTSLEPEHVNQIDFGLKFDNDTVRGELIAWRMHYQDRIISVATGDTTIDGREIVQSRNVTESDLWGIEAGARWQPSENTALSAVVNLSRGTDKDADGKETDADRLPPVNGKLLLEQHISDGWLLESYILFAAPQNRLSARDLTDPRIDPTGTAGWGILGMRSNYEFRNGLQLGLSVDNLLDKRYRIHGSGIDARGIGFGLSLQYGW